MGHSQTEKAKQIRANSGAIGRVLSKVEAIEAKAKAKPKPTRKKRRKPRSLGAAAHAPMDPDSFAIALQDLAADVIAGDLDAKVAETAGRLYKMAADVLPAAKPVAEDPPALLRLAALMDEPEEDEGRAFAFLKENEVGNG